MMLLKQSLKALIEMNGIEKINDALAEIYADRMAQAEAKGEQKLAMLFDEISEFYDEINRKLLVRPYRDDVKEPS
jgi:hypothetical protein